MLGWSSNSRSSGGGGVRDSGELWRPRLKQHSKSCANSLPCNPVSISKKPPSKLPPRLPKSSSKQAKSMKGSADPRSDRDKALDMDVFSNIDLDKHKSMLTDDSEADSWVCNTGDEDNPGFQCYSETSSSMSALDGELHIRSSLGLEPDCATICTLNGERVIMQTNIAFQPADDDHCSKSHLGRDETTVQSQEQPLCRRWPKISRSDGLEVINFSSTAKDVTTVELVPQADVERDPSSGLDNLEAHPEQVSAPDLGDKEDKDEKGDKEGTGGVYADPSQTDELLPKAAPTCDKLAGKSEDVAASLSKEKFCSILTFLKQVEQTDSAEIHKVVLKSPKVVCEDYSPRTVLEHEDAVSVAESSFTACSAEDTTDMAFSGIRRRIHELKDRIVKQGERILQLEKEKESVKQEKLKDVSLERERYSKELQEQAADYKAGIKKHVSISEKLMKDKDALIEKCANLTSNLNTAEAKFEEKLKSSKEQWNNELKRQKEAWNAGEKSRREAWIEKKTQEIKEMTIAGLEPHIESIHDCHKKELLALEERHNLDVQKQLQMQNIRHHQELSNLREQMLKERNELLDKERLAAHTRLNEMAEKYEQQALQQRMRIANDLAQELERSEASRREDKKYTQELLARFQKEAAEREDAYRKQHEASIQQLQTKAQAELSALTAQMESERAEWRKTINDRVCKELVAKTEAIEAKCMVERNKEIEVILDRLEREKEAAMEEQRREFMAQAEALHEEKKCLMKKIKENELHYMDLCKSMLESRTAAEKERAELHTSVDQLKGEIEQKSVVIHGLQGQIDRSAEEGATERKKLELCLMRQEAQLNSTLLELKKCRDESEQVRMKKVEELGELENKVKVAIEKKDEIIWSLRNQLETAHQQIRHTEQLLQQEQSFLYS